MQWYIADRRKGKTTAIIDWWLGDTSSRYIVVANDQERERVVKEILDGRTELLNFPAQALFDAYIADVKRHVVTAWGAVQLGRTGNVVLGFDNVDWILADLFRAPVEFVTATQRDPFIRADEGIVRIDSRS